MAVDWDKPIETKDGQPARLLGVLKDKRRTHVVAVDSGDGDGEYISECNEHGQVLFCDADHSDDIFNVPQRHVRWVNVYRTSWRDWVFQSREDADREALCRDRIACVRFEFEEGEGLS